MRPPLEAVTSIAIFIIASACEKSVRKPRWISVCDHDELLKRERASRSMACLVLGDAIEGGHGAVVEERHRSRRRRLAAGDDAAQPPRSDARYRARLHACVDIRTRPCQQPTTLLYS